MSKENVLELLDLYMDMVEKQDEIIYRLGKIVAKQATELEHLKTIHEFMDQGLENDIAIVNEVMEQYDEMKGI